MVETVHKFFYSIFSEAEICSFYQQNLVMHLLDKERKSVAL